MENRNRRAAQFAMFSLMTAIVLGSLMFRYDLVSTGHNAVARLDRWTGSVILCDDQTCVRREIADYEDNPVE